MSERIENPFDFSKLAGTVDPSQMFDTFNKALAEYRIPGVDTGALLDAQRKNVEALATANKQALEGVQAILARQGEMLRETMEEAQTALKDLSASSSPTEAATKHGELLKEAIEKVLSNMRELAEMTTKSNKAAFDTISKRLTESMKEIKHLTANHGKK